ncbi:MAG: beta-L-arabinofuranosidase domain-containing protein [Sediminicola sp.]
MKIILTYTLICFLLSLPIAGQMQLYDLEQVRLLDGPFKNAQEVDMQYILSLDPDRLLAPYRIDAGLPQKEPRYGNWESSGLDGHIGGHYLSALAMMYASTGKTELKDRLTYMISELAKCQDQNGNGYVGGIPEGKLFWDRIHKGDIEGSSFGLNNTWVPLYNIHKLFAGLYDAYHFAGNQQAKQILIGLGEWFVRLLEPLTDEQVQMILRTEHGGINESFADLYLLTKDEKFLRTAQRLSHRTLLDALVNGQDILTGLHANTQIPKVVGYEKIAGITNNEEWSEAVDFFWDNVTKERSVAFGGNSFREHFNPIDDFSVMLESNQGPETCNSYNMLRLGKALFLQNGSTEYLNFYERTLYNHILSSQHPEKGGFVYFTPIRPNHYRVYSQPETSMWCCVGSGLENHTKYGELIYAHMERDVFVNLFIPSKLHWKEKGLELLQKTRFPYENASEFSVVLEKAQSFAIHFRRPQWMSDMEILVNGEVQETEEKEPGYIQIHRKWKKGDTISLRFKTETTLEPLPDGSNWAAFVNGPIVLAAKTSVKNLDGLFADDSRMGHETKGRLVPLDQAFVLVDDGQDPLAKLRQEGNLRFGLDTLLLQPFYEIHDARYQMYFQKLPQQGLAEKKEALKQMERESLLLESKTVDLVNCGEQQPEVDHSYQGENSRSGYDDGHFWRSTLSYISYRLSNGDRDATNIQITALDNLEEEKFDVLINGQPAESWKLEGKTLMLTIAGQEEILLRIQAKNEAMTPRFNQIRLLKP